MFWIYFLSPHYTSGLFQAAVGKKREDWCLLKYKALWWKPWVTVKPQVGILVNFVVVEYKINCRQRRPEELLSVCDVHCTAELLKLNRGLHDKHSISRISPITCLCNGGQWSTSKINIIHDGAKEQIGQIWQEQKMICQTSPRWWDITDSFRRGGNMHKHYEHHC